MKIVKIPKPFDYKAACEALFNIMEPYFSNKTTKLSKEICYGLRLDRPFITMNLFDVQLKTIRGFFRNSIEKSEKLIARFEYFPDINNRITTDINESDFTDTFKEKLSKIEEICKNKIVFEVNVKEGY